MLYFAHPYEKNRSFHFVERFVRLRPVSKHHRRLEGGFAEKQVDGTASDKLSCDDRSEDGGV